MHRLLYLCLFVVGTCLMACHSSKPGVEDYVRKEEGVDLGYTQTKQKNHTGASRSEKRKNREPTLEGYLRKIPGLQVKGSGANSSVNLQQGFNSSVALTNQPLFVLDGVRIGHSLSEVSRLVVVSEIDKVTVLKTPSDTAMYGMSGSNGVIVIRTKK